MRRAAFDLSCAEAELRDQPLSGERPYLSVGVKGCGKQSTYVYVPQNLVWVVDAAALGQPPATEAK